MGKWDNGIMVMWVNLLFGFTIIVLMMFFTVNMYLSKNTFFKTTMSILIGGTIFMNLYFLWNTWGNIHVHGFYLKGLVMFWLAYPEYGLSIQFGMLMLVFLLVPFKTFRFRSILAMNLNFLVSLSFQVRILIRELPVETTGEYINVCYQTQNAAFVGAVNIFLVMALYFLIQTANKRQ